MVSFRGGLHALPTAVARALGDAVRLQTRVVGMRRVADGWSLALRTPRGDHALAADAVLFAGPAHAIGAMALPGRLAAALAPVAAVEHAPVATLALGFRRADVAHPLDGFGALAPAAERLQLLGVLFGSSIFAGRAPDGHVLLTCFLGGVRRPGPAAVPASELLPPVLAELRDLLGVSGAPTFVRHTAWGRAIPQYTVGYDAVTRAIAEAERDEPTLALAGQYRAGAAIGDCVRSGLAAAERLAAALAGGRAATAAYGAAAAWPGVPRVPELAP
jgi:oxygen-dependent protoporphyrinogen oxidase